MDVRRLHYLHSLATYGTITAAAEALQITGPAISQQLAALERETGISLVEKRGRLLGLTPAGQLLVRHAGVILGNLAAAEADLTALKDGVTGVLRLAAFPSAARVLVPPTWSAVTRDHEGAVELHLQEMEPHAALSALVRREVDIAIVYTYALVPSDLGAGCEQFPLFQEPVLLAISAEGADASAMTPGEPVDLARLRDHRWLTPHPLTSCYEMIRRACGAAGFVPTIAAEADDFGTLMALAAAGAGVAMVPRMAVPDAPAGVSLHPLTQPVTRTVFAVTRLGTGQLPTISVALGQLAGTVRTMWPDPVTAALSQ
jgi:DNA-binding transcriptional LysR family regulator